MKKYTTLLVFCALFLNVWSFENDLSSICVHPTSKEIYVGGEFKTIFVLDAKSGTTIRQIKLEHIVKDLQFSPDGKHLIAYDGRVVHFLNPKTNEETYSHKGTNVQLFENAPYYIEADWIFSKSIKVYSTADGSQVMSVKPDFDLLDASFDPEFKELIILGRSMEIKGEKGLITTEVEEMEGYNVYNKAYVEQQSDKKGSGFMVVDIASKETKLDVILPYETGKSFGLSISKYKEDYYLACWDLFLKVDKAGKAYPISIEEATFAYATNHSSDGKLIFVSSTKDGYVFNCETQNIITFDAREKNEFSYTVDFTQHGDDFYMLSKDYTVNVLNEKGMVIKRMKIDNSSENGFGIFYYNGFSKKEDRDKEAAIINEVRKTYGLDPIDLENGIGDSDFLIGTFDTTEAAEKFKSEIKKKGLSYLTKIVPME
ncbi:MAG: hypothetical protein WDZ35_12945 [Crocinitomicaceae bacterium]